MFGMNPYFGNMCEQAYYENIRRAQAMNGIQQSSQNMRDMANSFGQAGPPGHCGSGSTSSNEPLLLLLETEDNQGE